MNQQNSMITKKSDPGNYSVSVVIPAYNAGEYITRAIRSVIEQTYPPLEILVIDDGSSDNTAEQVKSFGQQIRYIYQDNAGVSAARNKGIRAAQGQWIAFLDADDEWLPEKLQLQTDLLKRNPDLVWVSSNYYRCLCQEDRRAIHHGSEKAEKLLQGKDYFSNFFEAFVNDTYGYTCTTIVRRNILININGFWEGRQFTEDMDLWWRIAYQHKEMGYTTKPLTIYHLGIPRSLSQSISDYSIFTEFIARQQKIARQYNRESDFTLAASYMLRGWMRGMLFQAKANEIRQILRDYDSLFPKSYKLCMLALMQFPGLTAGICHGISKLVRTLHLRRGLRRKPGKSNLNTDDNKS